MRGVAGNKDKLSAAIFRAVNVMTMVRTPASAPITLPDNTVAYPHLPPSNIIYVHCKYPRDVRRKVADITAGILSRMPAISDAQDDPDNVDIDVGGDTNALPIDTHQNSRRDCKTTRQQQRAQKLVTAHRLLCLLSLDVRAFEIAVAGEEEHSLLAALNQNPQLNDTMQTRLNTKLVDTPELLGKFILKVAAKRDHGSLGPGLQAGRWAQ